MKPKTKHGYGLGQSKGHIEIIRGRLDCAPNNVGSCLKLVPEEAMLVTCSPVPSILPSNSPCPREEQLVHSTSSQASRRISAQPGHLEHLSNPGIRMALSLSFLFPFCSEIPVDSPH